MNSISTYNTYLSTHQLSNYSASSVGWIFSIYIFVTFLCGIFIGPVFDARGPRGLVFAGSVLMMASIMLMGICTGTCKYPSRRVESRTSRSLTAKTRILALPYRLRPPRRPGHIPRRHARHHRNRPLLPDQARLRHRHRLHGGLHRRRHLPAHA